MLWFISGFRYTLGGYQPKNNINAPESISLIVGLGLVVLAGFLGVREHQWIKHAVLADGKVVALMPIKDSEGNTTYCPHVTFNAGDGSQYTFAHTDDFNLAFKPARYEKSANANDFGFKYPASYEIGETVKVAYDRATYEGRIMSFGQRFGAAVFLAGIGLGTVLTSVTFMIGRELFTRVYLK